MALIVDFPQQSSHASPPNEQRKVSFGELSDVKFVENIALQHRADLWFSKDEIDSFKYELAHILQQVRLLGLTMAQFAEQNAQDTSAFLGLEDYLSKVTFLEIKNRRRAVIRAVLVEQDRQNRFGIVDSEAIANVSRTVSDVAERRARIIGMLHAGDR